ncbi:MAG: hypothetical protein QM541_05790 [Flavobacterium sp.]|nr:hypothetical protein [Flavobacterium sp.]
MKQLLLSIVFATFMLSAFSQEDEKPKRLSKEEEPGHFRKDNVYIGGGVGLGFNSNTYGSNFNLGITPEIGYSFTHWLDMGVSLNLNYYSYNYGFTGGGTTKQRSFNYGGGVYLRAYPLQEFFIQVQPEYNFISTKLSYTNISGVLRLNQKAPSFLVGLGYGKRIVGQSGFYTAILLDLGQDNSSPYRQVSTDVNGYATGTTHAVPIIRAGFTYYLRPKKQK